MDPVDGISRAVRLLRRRLATGTPARERSKGVAATPAPADASTSLDASTRSRIAERIQALDATDPRFAERATEAFLQGVLLAEFGQELINDAQFRRLVLDVAGDMRGDPETARQLDQLIQTLRSE